jgi:FkbM family methyltransferase
MKTTKKIALARLAYLAVRRGRAFLGWSDHVVASRGGFKYELDLFQGIDFAIYILGAFERSTRRALRRYVRPGMTVLDIGANIGAHTLILGKLVKPGGRVLAFEPTEYAFNKLLKNVTLNPKVDENIQCFQYFLTSYSEPDIPELIYSSWPLTGGQHLHALHLGEAKGTRGAKAAALDKVLADLSINKVDLLKLDVDGFESDVLEGAAEMLKRNGPVVVAEFAPYVHNERGKSFAKFVDILSNLGYSFYDQHTDELLPGRVPDIEAQIGVGSSRNVIARLPSAS